MREETFSEQANAYIDGELNDAETAAFEAQMRTDPALAEAVDRVRAAEAGLREVFGQPVEVPDPFASAAAEHAPRRRLFVPLAAAAAVMIAAAGLWYTYGSGAAHTAPSGRFIYRTVTASFTPAVVCDTPEKFLDYTEQTLDEPISADFASAADLGISLVGWSVLGGSYDDAAAEKLPRLLLARGPDGTEVVVYFRERGHGEPQPDAQPGSGQSGRDPIGMHTKQLGRVTAYEISPLGEPVVLGLLDLD